MKALGRECRLLQDAFTPNKRFLYVFGVDALYIVAMVFGGGLILKFLSAKTSYLFAAYDLSTLDLARLESLAIDFKSFLIAAALSLVIFLLLLIFGWGLSRTLVWKYLRKEKFTKKAFLKCTALKLVWQVIWLPLIIIFYVPVHILSTAVRENPLLITKYAIALYANIFLYLIIAYFGLFMYSSFFKHHKIYDAIADSFRNGAKSLKKMVLPVGFMVLSYAILYVIILGLANLGFYSILLNIILVFYAYVGLKIYIIEKVI